MSSIAYGLRADYDGTVEVDGDTVPTFTGGIVRAGDHDFDVRAELDADPAGLIVVDENNAALIVALDGHPALKRVRAPDGPSISRFDPMTVAELKAELELRELPLAGRRDELVARLEAVDAGLPIPSDDPTTSEGTVVRDGQAAEDTTIDGAPAVSPEA